MRRCSTLDIFQHRYRVMTSKNDADFVHFVMPAQAPASQNGQSRAYYMYLRPGRPLDVMMRRARERPVM